MIELSIQEINMTAGATGPDWGEVGAGLAGVGLGVAIAATPVGWVGAAGAALASFYGGVAIGDGFAGGGIAGSVFSGRFPHDEDSH